MAKFSLEINFDAAEEARIMQALKAAAATSDKPDPTDDDAFEWLRQRLLGIVKSTVRDMETRAAINAITDVGAT